MKTPMLKPVLTIIALLVAGVMLPDIQTYAARGASSGLARANRGASNVRNMTNQQGKQQQKQGGDGLVANEGENWYIEITPGYIHAGGSQIDTFYGASVSLGYRFAADNRVQLEIGLYGSQNFTDSNFSYSTSVVYDGIQPDPGTGVPTHVSNLSYPMPLTGTRSAKATAVPVLLDYTYSIRLDSAGHWEFRVTPAAGILGMFDTWNVKASGTYTAPANTIIDSAFSADGSTINKTESYSGSDSKYTFALGGGFGLTWYFSNRWYADIGYRYLWTGKVRNAPPTAGPQWNGISAWNGMNTHVYSLALGWKF